MEQLHYRADGRFKILQIADIQDTAVFSPDTARFLREVLKREAPDLVVLSGDQIKGYSIAMRTGDSIKKAEDAIRTILALFEETNTPFAPLFGNHDEFRKATRERQWEIYRSSPLCLGTALPDGKVGFTLALLGTDGSLKNMLYGFDTGGQDSFGGGYHPVDERQIEQYRKTRDRLIERNGCPTPSLAFQHVPVPEVYELLDETGAHTRGAVAGIGSRRGKYFVLSDRVRPGGTMKEYPAVPERNSGEFDALCEKGDIMGLYFGHDHRNCFIGNWRGVDLGYTPCCGFHTYGPGLDRAVRVFELDETEPTAYRTRILTYRRVCGSGLREPFVNFLGTHAPSSFAVFAAGAKKAGAAAALLGAAALTVRTLIQKRK